MPRLYLTLVHGTFARSARWIMPNSPFAKKCLEILGNDAVVVPFHWSGRNSYFERLKAGVQLSKHLHAVATEYPNSDQVVVAHSHGGNVLLYAMRLLRVTPRLRGVIFLSTPFLKISPRENDGILFLMVIALIAIVSLTVGFLLLFFLMKFDFVSLLLIPEVVHHLIVIAIVTFFTLLMGKGLWSIGSNALSAMDAYSHIRANELNVDPEEFDIPSMAIRIERDEAALWLRLLIYVSRLPRLFSHLLEWIFDNLFEVWVICTYLALGVGAVQNRYPGDWWIPIFLGLGLIPFSFLLSAIVLPLTWVGLFLSRGHRFGFGERLLDSLLLDVRLHSGNSQVLRRVKLGIRSIFEIRHSRVHEQENVAEYISRWIKRGCDDMNQIALLIGAQPLARDGLCQWGTRKILIKTGPQATVPRRSIWDVNAVIYGEYLEDAWVIYEIDSLVFRLISVTRRGDMDESLLEVSCDEIRRWGRKVDLPVTFEGF
jgi:hypothetical protein